MDRVLNVEIFQLSVVIRIVLVKTAIAPL